MAYLPILARMKKLIFLLSIIGFVRLIAQNDSINKVNAQGEKTGKWIEGGLHDGDSLKSIGYYKNGLAIGEWRTYYNNGVLEAIYTFDEDGKQDGVMKTFYKRGDMEWVFVVEHGKVIYSAKYRGKGNLFSESYKGIQVMYDKNGKCWLGDCKKLMGK